MPVLVPFTMGPEELARLRERVRGLPDISQDAALAVQLAALGMRAEIGTENCQLTRFVFDARTGQPVPEGSLRSELVRYGHALGIRIWAEGTSSLDVRLSGLRELLHPAFSFAPGGELPQLVIFPESVARILALRGVEIAIVRDWALNTVFGGFAHDYYVTNFWELENNDTLRYARMVERRQLVFLGTHDLVAHVAGVRADAWDSLARDGRRTREVLTRYFGGIERPTIASLVMPYAAGVVLDDLAQPPVYGDPRRRVALAEILAAIERSPIDPRIPRVLTRFPDAYRHFIELSRGEAREPTNAATLRASLSRMEDEIRRASFVPAA